MDEQEITEKIIGAAIAVHRHFGPGLLEKVYENALVVELKHQNLDVKQQIAIPAYYRNVSVGEHRLDLLVETKVVVELKSSTQNERLFEAQILSYMRLGGFPLGLLINFNNAMLKHGIRRYRL